MNLPEKIQSFFDKAPISLVADSGGFMSVSEIEDFYKAEIAPQVKDDTYGRLCYAGLLMAQDYIWEAHEIVQNYPQIEASWWHAFMHRMEGDYGNSGYWYRRVGQPSSYVDFQGIIGQFELPGQLGHLQDRWDPFAFNDCISRYSDLAARESVVKIHRTECAFLFSLCLAKAV